MTAENTNREGHQTISRSGKSHKTVKLDDIISEAEKPVPNRMLPAAHRRGSLVFS